MIGYPSPRREWSVERKLHAIRAAGFDGVCAYITPEIATVAGRLGLRLMSGFDAKSVADALPRLRAQRDAGVRFINIQLLNHDTPPARSAPVAVKLIREARKLGLAVHIETHRDTVDRDPGKIRRAGPAVSPGHRGADARDLGSLPLRRLQAHAAA
jgi:hypothetical protein